jgi:hypothetical protein
LPAYTALVLAHRGPANYGRRVGRRVLIHILASRVLQAPLGSGDHGHAHLLDTAAIWNELVEAASHFLFNYDKAAPFDTWGAIVKNVLGRRLKTSRSSSVGLLPLQWRKLRRLADPSSRNKDGNSTAIFTKPEAAMVPEIIDAADVLFLRRYARHRDKSDRYPAELLDLLLQGKLDVSGVAVTEEVVRRINRDAKKQRNTIHVDAQDLVDGGDAEQFLADLVEQSADRDHLLGLQDIVALDDRQAREAAIERTPHYCIGYGRYGRDDARRQLSPEDQLRRSHNLELLGKLIGA